MHFNKSIFPEYVKIGYADDLELVYYTYKAESLNKIKFSAYLI